MVIAVTTAAFTVTTGTAAQAIGGCATTAAIRSCVDHVPDSGQVRADFYLLSSPTSSVYSYRVFVVINNREISKFPEKRRLTTVKRYCCWYQPVRNLPPKAQEAFTRIKVYNSNGVLHYSADSPTIRYTE